MTEPRTWILQFAGVFLALFVVPILAVDTEPIAPLKPAEFVIISLQLLAGQAQA